MTDKENEILNYSIALQRAIEYHCAGKIVPDKISKQCPYHAKKLNDFLPISHLFNFCSLLTASPVGG